VLITGSNGFIGSRVVAALLARGFTQLRCFVRPSSDVSRLRALVDAAPAGASIEFLTGDLLSTSDCERGVAGVAVIYHLAAGFDKSFASAFMNSALATRNLLEAAAATGALKRFVNVSSFAVYSGLELKPGALLDERSPLESAAQERCDAYGFGKLKQEELVRRYGRERGVSYVILRPGAVFGPGKRELSGRIAIKPFGFLIHVGGHNRVPLTYVDNCADAIVLAGLKPGVDGEVFNVVDDDPLTSAEFFHQYRKRVGQRFYLPLPYPVGAFLSRVWEQYSRWSKNQLPAAFNRRRCAAEWRRKRFSNSKLKERLGWSPRVPMRVGMSNFLAQFEAPRS
jgi:nucleoside-diphosphate-sugar epimerase